MSKDDTASGLLSKLVKFVRNPATNWTELDSVDAEKDDSVNKKLLKEMIERKRSNDFVRKREFDMLRNLRKLEALADTSNDAGSRPSFFQSSMTSRPDDRASTLKKIDEIEAQMSMQWWKSKNPTAPDNRSRPASPEARNPAPDSLMPVTYQPTMPAGTDTVAPAEEPMLNDLLAGLPQAPARLDPSGRTDAWDSGALALNPLLSSKPVTVPEPPVIEHDAELEEAAILFANGDDAAAEAGLLELLASGALRAEHVQTWLTLFDLYRATGEQDKFETSAIEFAVRFGRSAPQWFSLPDMVNAIVKPADKVPRGAAADWICPSVVGVQTVGALNAAIARAAMPWRLDWRNLKTIDASALEPLYKVFSNWANRPVQLRFMGDAQLQKVLLDTTPSGDRATDQKWWLLRMELMRVIHRPDDFELTALDFCVTYEVSPPAWDSAACEYKSLDEGEAMGSSTIIGEPSSERVHSSFNFSMEGDSIQDFLSSSPANRFLSVELSGQIQGHAAAVLDRLEASLMGADMMQISCAKLIRVDFSAAGMLLNWVSARQAEKRSVEFSDVNRLIAAFFNVIGITEYARVVVRND
ncbi:MAG: STAS domain-containing protein [Polaromonas sp.]